MMLSLLITPPVTAPQPVDPGGWLRDSDYPPSARRDGAEGRAGVRLTVDATGRVVGCEITLSSGRIDLDEATCRRVSERGRFRPARTTAGKATRGTASLTFSWTLADADRRPTDSGKATVVTSFSDEGRLVNCREDGPVVVFMGFDCQSPFVQRPPPVGVDGENTGGPRIVHMVSTQRFDGRPPAMVRPAGATILSESVVRVVVDANGDVTDCEVVREEGALPARLCDNDGKGIFVAGDAGRAGYVGAALWVVEGDAATP